MHGSRLHRHPEVAHRATVIVETGMMQDSFLQSLMATAKADNMFCADLHLMNLLSFCLENWEEGS